MALVCSPEFTRATLYSPVERAITPPGMPDRSDLVRVAAAAAGSVVRCQSTRQMLQLPIKVVAEYVATVSEVGIGVNEVVIWPTDLFLPKRHCLHQALSAGSEDRIAIKSAFHFNNGEH